MKYVLNYIIIREKLVAGVLDTILVWTEKQTTKEKRKQDKEEKKIKKTERVARMEQNKKVKAEKVR